MMRNEDLARKIVENKFVYKNSFTVQGNHRSVPTTEFFFKLPNDEWLIVWMRTQDVAGFLKNPSQEVEIFNTSFESKTPPGLSYAPMWGTDRAKAARKPLETKYREHYELIDEV